MTSELEKMANIAARKISYDSHDWGLINAGFLAGAKAVLEFARRRAHDFDDDGVDLVPIKDLEKFAEGDNILPEQTNARLK